MKWRWREITRLYRLHINPEGSVRLLVKTVGLWWLVLHGAKREYKVKLYKTGDGWYCVDIAIPRKKLALEAKGGFRKYYDGDILRDQGLENKGWSVLRVTEAEMKADPRGQRRKLRKFLRG